MELIPALVLDQLVQYQLEPGGRREGRLANFIQLKNFNSRIMSYGIQELFSRDVSMAAYIGPQLTTLAPHMAPK